MPKVTEVSKAEASNRIKAKTRPEREPQRTAKWWKLKKDGEIADAICDNAAFLKQQQAYRYRQASIYSRLYGNMPVGNYFGRISTLGANTPSGVPVDRPTFNLVQACVDTLNSRLVQSKPRPYFLTDGGDYKKRSLAKRLNQFTYGEFYRCKVYEIGEQVLRDAQILGTGCVKVYEDQNKRVAVERVLAVDLLVDEIDAMFGFPTQITQLKLVDRDTLCEMFPKKEAEIMDAAEGLLDSSGSSRDSIADQVLVAESWHLRSGPNAKDGRHSIAIQGVLLYDDKEWNEDEFPFVFLQYAPRTTGFWAQGIPERLMGTQVEINKLLITTSRAINLVGVPRVLMEESSKVVKAHFNNEIGGIISYRGTKPEVQVFPCMPAEVYQQIQRLIDYGFQQEGVSQLSASAMTPAGLNSGEAIREYDDTQTDRFATLAKRWENFYIQLAHKMIMQVREIAEREGGYDTLAPGRYDMRTIEFPDPKLTARDFLIQCYPVSSLPKDPAGRSQKIVEWMQAGILSAREARRLMDFQDLEQIERLANAAEERVFMVLDEIVEDGKFTPPDESFDLGLCETFGLQYQNLYAQAKLEKKKMQLLRNFVDQTRELKMQMQAPQAGQLPGGPPLAQPEPLPTSPMLPQQAAA